MRCFRCGFSPFLKSFVILHIECDEPDRGRIKALKLQGRSTQMTLEWSFLDGAFIYYIALSTSSEHMLVSSDEANTCWVQLMRPESTQD